MENITVNKIDRDKITDEQFQQILEIERSDVAITPIEPIARQMLLALQHLILHSLHADKVLIPIKAAIPIIPSTNAPHRLTTPVKKPKPKSTPTTTPTTIEIITLRTQRDTF